MMVKRNVIFTVLILSYTFSFSQLQVKNYFSVTGKKDVAINTIIQDKNGYLWLGTKEGVYKFDGKSSQDVFKDYPQLKQEITSLFIDHNKTFWVGTKTGKVFFYKNNRLDSLDFSKTHNEEKITSLIEINSTLFIGTYGNGLYALNNKQLKHYDSNHGLSDNVIYTIATDGKDRIWCGTDGGITQIKNLKAKPYFTIISDKNGLPDNITRDLTLNEGKLFISMQDSGACYYNLTTSKIERIPFFNNWNLGTIINGVEETPKKITVATEKNGIIVIDNGKISVYKYEETIQNSIINQLFIDNSRQIWIASKKGLNQLYSRRFDLINSNNGLIDDKILALVTDNDHSIWIGTTSGISKIMENDEGKIQVSKIQDITKYTISCAAKAPNGDIWFGTYGNGIIILSAETNKSVIINSKENGLSNDNVSNIYFSDENTVYISSLGGGLMKASTSDEIKIKVEKTYSETEGLGSDYVYAALTDNNSNLFVATDGGGLQVLKNNKFVSITKKFKLNSNTVFSICKDKNNAIWATTNANGIIKYDGKTVISINQSNGLRDEQPQQLISSGNTVYAINSKGIDKINCTDNVVTYYDLFDGDLEPNLNAVFFSQNNIYSGTNNGVLVFRTSQEPKDTIKPSVFISNIQINYKPFNRDLISEFKYNQNNISIEFAGIWLKNSDKLTYRHKLIGFEDQWIYTNESKLLNYNNLSSGNYIFIVQSKNEEDVWSNEATYSFTILTPLWQRWWFWVLVVSIGGLSIYAFLKYRLKEIRKENLLLEQRVNERTFEIEKQSKIIEDKNVALEQLSLVASRTDNVVLILDAEGRLEYVNESFVRLNRITLEELKRNHGETIFDISNNPNIKTIVAEAVYHKKSVNYEALNLVADGVEIWESSTLTPIFDDEGILKKIIIIDTNVTERKKQEQIIYQKNKDITDSISYARKIQHAILPQNDLIKTYLPNSFVLYMTKDIVSGDFYWFTHINGSSIIAAVDCTGHGVPGAFMSLIGYNILNKIVNEQKITDPKAILLELNNGILEALYKNESESKDGMDIAICKINHKKNTVDYAGAMRPLWIINNNELREIKADKIPIGTTQESRDLPIQYTTHTIHAIKGDTFYIFTDGYADQFGGAKNKKYSTSKFKDLLIKNSNQNFNTQETNCKLEHLQWKNNFEQVDDILVIGFTI
ncbi:MAG: SpoIIE family protein phosphatase [Burkholderiales bacterium]|nr:SpoIIE family protein phosphatase [Bacteroidia bacterium]